jgi:long-subunit acyl-CoA synthetase (AMP-forming)
MLAWQIKNRTVLVVGGGPKNGEIFKLQHWWLSINYTSGTTGMPKGAILTPSKYAKMRHRQQYP